MVKVICNKCEKESNEKEVYCLSCYSEAINKIKELEEEIEALLKGIHSIYNPNKENTIE